MTAEVTHLELYQAECAECGWRSQRPAHGRSNPMTALTSARLTEIRDRAEAATGGPWSAFTTGVRSGDHWGVVAGTDSVREAVAWITANDGENEAQREPDAVFIAAARTDVPDLLAEIDSMRSALDVHLGWHESLRSTLALCADRMDEFTYSEFACDLDDRSFDSMGDEYRSKLSEATAALDAAHATITAIRERHTAGEPYGPKFMFSDCTECGRDYPCPTVRALTPPTPTTSQETP